jgi:hypothetical protein
MSSSSFTDEHLDKALDKLIDDFPIDVQFSKLLAEAEKRFSDVVEPSDFAKIATLLWQKKKLQASFREGSVRWH